MLEGDYQQKRSQELGLPVGTGKRYNEEDLLRFLKTEEPPLITELRQSGFTIEIRRDQNNKLLARALGTITRSVSENGQIFVIAQEGIQFEPSTLYLGIRGKEKIFYATSESPEGLKTTDIILVDPTFALIDFDPTLKKPFPLAIPRSFVPPKLPA